MKAVKIGRIFCHNVSGKRIKVMDIEQADGIKYNFIFYVEMDVPENVPRYRLKLPEHTFINKYSAQANE